MTITEASEMTLNYYEMRSIHLLRFFLSHYFLAEHKI